MAWIFDCKIICSIHFLEICQIISYIKRLYYDFNTSYWLVPGNQMFQYAIGKLLVFITTILSSYTTTYDKYKPTMAID